VAAADLQGGCAEAEAKEWTALLDVESYAVFLQTARPFNWKYTATDLVGTLDRISAHQQPAKPPASLPKAA
jgi:hypothetical protein